MAKLSNFWMSQFSMDICGRFMVGEPPLPQGGFISGSLILPGKSTHGDHQEWVSAGWNVERRGANVCFNKNHPTNGPAVFRIVGILRVLWWPVTKCSHFFGDKSHTCFADFSGVFHSILFLKFDEKIWDQNVLAGFPITINHRPSTIQSCSKKVSGGKSSTLDLNHISSINAGLFGAPAVLLVV